MLALVPINMLRHEQILYTVFKKEQILYTQKTQKTHVEVNLDVNTEQLDVNQGRGAGGRPPGPPLPLWGSRLKTSAPV